MNESVERMTSEIRELSRRLVRRIRLMEVCGTHTVAVFRSGIRSMLPANVRLISGPGCPVCVTAQRHIDAAIELASRDGVIMATYGDMVRVPGRLGSLEQRRAAGADVRVIQSARTAVKLAVAHPSHSVVFLAVGFETTAPATAAAILEAARQGLKNLTILSCHKLVVPAMQALLQTGDVPLDGFLCPGHVSVVIGADAYRSVVDDYGKPCVIVGFETPLILDGICRLMRQVVEGHARLENAYPTVVSNEGNRVALALMDHVFEPVDTAWRELGVIPGSGLELRPAFCRFDALRRFGLGIGKDEDHPACRCGEVIRGKIEPDACPLFDRGCTPLTPVGPCMVSSEGTCAAWHKYNRLLSRRHKVEEAPEC